MGISTSRTSQKRPLPVILVADRADGLYARLRLLSLDVAFGALAGGTLVSAFLAQHMHPSWYLILPVSVWVLYTWDHLLDAERLGADASTARHQFHHRHFRPLLLATIVGTFAAVLTAVVFLGTTGVFFGLGMGGIATLHFLIVRFVGARTSPFLVKELGVALVYCAGIWGLPAIESGRLTDPILWIGFGQFLFLALTNLLEFSLFELETDEADGHTSVARGLGPDRTVNLIRLVLGAFVGLGALGVLLYGPQPFERLELTYLPMAVILAALILRPDIFARNERYRAWGDGAFLLPFLYRLLP